MSLSEKKHDINGKHFASPNFSSILPAYTNIEADDIRSAFSTGNHISLRELPANIKHLSVVTNKVEKSRTNLRTTVQGGAPRKLTKSGLFEEFEYIPSRYSLADEILMKERLEDEAIIQNLGGNKAFIAGCSKAKLKYENFFEDKEGTTEAFSYISDPYETAENEVLRNKWIQKSRILHGPFVPSGIKKTLAEPSKSNAPYICSKLQQRLSNDWQDVDVIVDLSPDCDSIVIRFPLMMIDSAIGVEAYMNCLLRNNEIVVENKLRKKVEDWNCHSEDGFLYFSLSPPWVNVRKNDAYYNLHPEKKLFTKSKSLKSY